ncbi:MAG: hypothetical protein NUV94_06170 [Candidatus Acetothermia bacterium]|jgi:hypothetical protein|nr:hypothetical protein [Candidatus Acetothermia bacterium]
MSDRVKGGLRTAGKVVAGVLPALGILMALAGCGRVAARIDAFSPGDPIQPARVEAGGTVTLSVTFTNTGNRARPFIAKAVVWDAMGAKVDEYKTSLASPLAPGQQTTVSWTHTVRQAGDYMVQFSVWKDVETILEQQPRPPQKLVVGTAATVATGKFRIGDRVRVTQNVNVRTNAGTQYPEISHVNYRDHAPVGSQGKVVDGPKQADNFVWWKVEYDAGFSGWSVETALEKIGR